MPKIKNSKLIAPDLSLGNSYLKKQYELSHSNDRKEREKAIPILFFQILDDGKRRFCGYGIVESIKLVTQYSGKYVSYSNYYYTFCVFSLAEENDDFNWKWIDERRELGYKAAAKIAPEEWKTWIETGDYNKVRRHVYAHRIFEKEEQLPTKSTSIKVLKIIHDYYNSKDNSKNEMDKKGSPYKFEFLAKEVTKDLIKESGTAVKEGWVTKKSSDGGIDFVLRVDIGQPGLSHVRQVILGQAKCNARDNSVSANSIDRIVARLKRGWIAAFVTTSYFSTNLQKEILDDKFPIILISGKEVAHFVETQIKPDDDGKELEDYDDEELKKKITKYLDSVKGQISNTIPEEILKGE